MRKMLIIAAAILAGAGSAVAGEDRHAVAQSRVVETIRKELESTGYQVHRVKAEHGAYKVRAVNDSGFPITATYDGTSGELIRAALR